MLHPILKKFQSSFFQYHLPLILLLQTVPQLLCINAQTQGTICFCSTHFTRKTFI